MLPTERPLRYIIVDDTEAVSTNIQWRMKGQTGLKFQCSFTHPLQALEFLTSSNPIPDILFLDYEMPQMNGDEFLDKLEVVLAQRGIQKHPNVVYVSGHADRAADLIHSHSSVCSFLRKPFTDKHIQSVLAKLPIHRTPEKPPSPKTATVVKTSLFELRIEDDTLKIKYYENRETKMSIIPIKDLIQVVKIGKKVEVRVKKEAIESHVHYGTILAYYSLLGGYSEKFKMLNRVHLVNMDQIKVVKGKVVTMSDGSSIRTSIPLNKLFKTL